MTSDQKNSIDFFSILYKIFADNKIIMNEKEKYVINSLPTLYFAKQALHAYKCREA
jgi:hypothetical protein